MSTSPNYRLIDFDYEPKTIFNILYKDKNLLDSEIGVFIAPEESVQQIRNLLNLPNIHHIIYFLIPPGKFSSIHLDSAKTENLYNAFATNLPLNNCDKVKMNWFSPLVDKVTIDQSIYPQVPSLPDHEVRYIDSVYYTQPVSVDILTWHNVINESSDYVYFCSLRFLND